MGKEELPRVGENEPALKKKESEVLKEPLKMSVARNLARTIMNTDPLRMAFSPHAWDEMGKEEITDLDVCNVIRAGVYVDAEFEKGSWRYRVQTRKYRVVIAFRSK